jgi:hypothetical protein
LRRFASLPQLLLHLHDLLVVVEPLVLTLTLEGEAVKRILGVLFMVNILFSVFPIGVLIGVRTGPHSRDINFGPPLD